MKPRMIVGRYEVHETIAVGGMGAVHLGRLLGAVGFGRIVAIKRMHPQLADEPEVAGMFIDEARLASRIQHPHVVSVLDVVHSGEELLLVMEYVRGESLASLLKAARRAGRPAPVRVVVAIVAHALLGLHAAHEARGADGTPLELVHRDISPQNILVGADGMARVLDFGIAKSTQRLHSTRKGEIKGKPAYMAPEQLLGRASRRTDIYSTGVVLWEALAGRRLVTADSDVEVIAQIMKPDRAIDPPSLHRPEISPALDAIVKRAVATDPEQRFATAREMALALEQTGETASSAEVSAWVETVAGEALAKRDAIVASIETSAPEGPPPASVPRAALATDASGPVDGSTGSFRHRSVDRSAETHRAVALPPTGGEPIGTERSRAGASRSPLITLAAAFAFLAGAGILALAFRSPAPPALPAASSSASPPAAAASPPSAASPAAPATASASSAAASGPDGGAPVASASSVAPRGAGSAPPRAPGPRTGGKHAPDFL